MVTVHEATDEPTGAFAGEDTSGAQARGYKAERVTADGKPAGKARPAYGAARDASVGTLISNLLSDTSRLVRDEVRLAKAEVSDKASQAVDGGKNVAIGGALLLLGAIYLILGLVYLLALVLPAWAAAFIVGGVIAIIGAILLKKGTSELKAKNLAPTRTRDNVQRDVRTVKESV